MAKQPTRAEYVSAFERMGFDPVTAQTAADRCESGRYFGIVDVTETLLASPHMADLAGKAHFIREQARIAARRLEPRGPMFNGKPLSEAVAEAEADRIAEVEARQAQAERSSAAHTEAAAKTALARIDECLAALRTDR